MEKLNLPYYKVAKEALVKWHGLSVEEAEKTITNSTFEEIDDKVGAKYSMDCAIGKIAESLYLTEEEMNNLVEGVYEGNEDGLSQIKSKIDKSGKKIEEVIMDALFAVHDGWVKKYPQKFNARESKHQHMPSELIGWKEAKSDLLFIKPIFESAGIEVSEEVLEEVYKSRVKEFFVSKNIKTSKDLAEKITEGEEFYPVLEGQDDVLETLRDLEKVESVVITQIEANGIGNIEEIAEKIEKEQIIERIEKKKEELGDLEQKYNQIEQEKNAKNIGTGDEEPIGNR